jgi:Flp pilus assembly protein TadB
MSPFILANCLVQSSRRTQKAKHAAARSNATRLQKAAAEAKAVADEMWKRERETRLVDGEKKASRGGLASTIYFESVS